MSGSSEDQTSVVRGLRQGCRRTVQWLRHLHMGPPGLSSASDVFVTFQRMTEWMRLEGISGGHLVHPLCSSVSCWCIQKRQMSKCTDITVHWIPHSFGLSSSRVKYESRCWFTGVMFLRHIPTQDISQSELESLGFPS